MNIDNLVGIKMLADPYIVEFMAVSEVRGRACRGAHTISLPAR